MRQKISLIIILSFLGACTLFAPIISDTKKASSFEDTPREKEVHRFFWDQLHQANYNKLDQVIDSLHASYIDDLNDFKLAAHLGFAYAWKITERRRSEDLTPSIVSSSDLALRYFNEAVALNSNDPRLKGFQAGFLLANGNLHNDDELTTLGYFKGQKAIKDWPSFNLFSIGYVMSQLPYNSERYKEALEYQWVNLEECLCREIDRENPNLSDIKEIPERVKNDYLKNRACTNGWIAPHNVEGFMLNLGDMLVKAGKTEQAKVVYNSIRQIEEFDQWPHQDKLISRIDNLEGNVDKFRRQESLIKDNRQVFIETTYGCMGCHQKSEKEFRVQNLGKKDVPLTRSTYFIEKNN